MNNKLINNKMRYFLDRNFSGESIDYHRIISLFIPILVDQAFVVCLNLVNTAMISSSGVAAVSAVNMVDSLNIFLLNVFIAVSTGGTVVVAQYKGSGNAKMVPKAAAGSISSVFLLAAAIGIIIIVFHGPALTLLFGHAQKDVLDDARVYMIGSGLSYCGIAIEEAVCGALRGVGETRSSLGLSLIMNLSYVFLNVLFINTLHFGILGMSISVNIARYFAAVCALVYITKYDEQVNFPLRELLVFNPSMLKKIFYIGLPFAAEQMFFNGGKILTQIFIVSLGTLAIATNAICISFQALLQIPGNALSLTIITVVGQCIGRRNIKDARKFVRSFLFLSSFSFLAISVAVITVFGPLLSLFHPPESIVHDIYEITIINAVAQIPLWSVAFVTPSALRAAGDSKFTSVVSMLSMWLFRVVLGYVLGILLHFGIVGVWVAMDCEWAVRGTVFLSRFHGSKWYAHHLID